MLTELLNGPDVPLWNVGDKPWVSRYFPFKTLHEMLQNDEHRGRNVSLSFQELTVPDIQRIPILELAKFIGKDKPEPICKLISQLVAKYGPQITEADISGEVVTHLLAISKRLWPTLGDVVIGVAGNIPTPILVNPIGILGLAKGIRLKAESEKEYPWVLALHELRELTESKR
jgi:hypothetical protein